MHTDEGALQTLLSELQETWSSVKNQYKFIIIRELICEFMQSIYIK
jgi:hypothetical protein